MNLVAPDTTRDRLTRDIFLIFLLILIAILFGYLGYHYIVGLSSLDSLLYASFMITGMGGGDPITINTTKWKVFSIVYALFAGIFYLLILSLLIRAITRLIPL